MKAVLKWLNEALAAKDLVAGMTYYRVRDRQICATDGRLTGGHPWPHDGEFLAPGAEFEKLLARMPEAPVLQVLEDSVRLRCGRFSGTVKTLPAEQWAYPGVEDAQWQPLPPALLPLLAALRPFISDNAVQPWAMCVALENDWAYATNNVALAGAPCAGLGAVQALLPCWAVDFVISRASGLAQWAWTPHYVAFRWANGAWMRAQLVVGQFPERAAAMVRAAASEAPAQAIDSEFRAAFEQVAELAEDTIHIYADRMESSFGRAVAQGAAQCQVPPDAPCSIWGAKYLLPALRQATHWAPASWPKPAAFKGPVLAGYVVGRR